MNLEQVPDTFPHLFIGYSIIFALLAAYIFFLGSRTSKIEKKLRDLEQQKNNGSR